MKLKSLIPVLTALVATAAHAQTFVAANGIGPQNINRLSTFTAANPAGWSTIGPMASDSRLFTGLDFAGVGGGLYAWAVGGVGLGLYSVNQTTGAATRIGGSATNIQDLSWNPVTGQMVGVQSSSTTSPIELVNIDLATGATTSIGVVSGISGGLALGLGHDAAGNAYIQDIAGDRVHKLNGLASVGSISLGRDTNFSQGMTLDWSGNGKAYVAAIGNVGGFFSELLELDFGTMTSTSLGNFGTATGTFPTFEGNDIAINPVPEPATMTALGLGLAALLRRKNRKN